jgi:hypothetical protein
MAPPQPLQVQLPSTFGLSPCCGADESPPPLTFLAWQSRHVSPALLRGSNGNCVIAAPHPLQVQFP